MKRYFFLSVSLLTLCSISTPVAGQSFVAQVAALGDYIVGDHFVPLSLGSVAPGSQVTSQFFRWKYSGTPGTVYCDCGEPGEDRHYEQEPEMSFWLVIGSCIYEGAPFIPQPDGTTWELWSRSPYGANECPAFPEFSAVDTPELRLGVGPDSFLVCCYWTAPATAHLEQLDVDIVVTSVAVDQSSWGKVRSLYRCH